MNSQLSKEIENAAFPVMTFPSNEHPLVVRAVFAQKIADKRDDAIALLRKVHEQLGEYLQKDADSV